MWVDKWVRMRVWLCVGEWVLTSLAVFDSGFVQGNAGWSSVQ